MMTWDRTDPSLGTLFVVLVPSSDLGISAGDRKDLAFDLADNFFGAPAFPTYAPGETVELPGYTTL